MSPRQKKSTSNGVPLDNNESNITTTSSSLAGLLAAAAEASTDVEGEEVKVNNASATEMKHACDDALKRFLSRPELFNQIYTHTDVRLALGWASVFVAGATGLYGWKVEFEQSKPVVWAGVILYVALTVLQTLYAYFIEKDTVFVGKRKTFDKRIVTERITISSRTSPPTSSPSQPSSFPSLLSSPKSSKTTTTPPTPPFPSSSLPTPLSTYTSSPNVPQYTLDISFLRSTSGGKSLLGKGKTKVSAGYNAFFDEKGRMDVPRFEKWVGECVAGVMEKNE